MSVAEEDAGSAGEDSGADATQPERRLLILPESPTAERRNEGAGGVPDHQEPAEAPRAEMGLFGQREASLRFICCCMLVCYSPVRDQSDRTFTGGRSAGSQGSRVRGLVSGPLPAGLFN